MAARKSSGFGGRTQAGAAPTGPRAGALVFDVDDDADTDRMIDWRSLATQSAMLARAHHCASVISAQPPICEVPESATCPGRKSPALIQLLKD
jgi:hypothetical protein